jgi:uncharacterized zinc-type alcohol dehydrogenase-like protein
MKTAAYGATESRAPLGPMTIDRREPGPNDVVIDILFAGICHSDIHQARSEWGPSMFPMVPGHEIVGRISRVGANVKKLAVGDLGGVGCMVDSCRVCTSCERDYEQFCAQRPAWTYNGTEMDRVTPTFGGYSQQIVVTERFVAKVPAGLDPAGAAPLLCAGITTYSPLVQWKCAPGMKVGVVGLGGLGHMGVKLAAAMGAEVTMFSTSPSKAADAARLGAADFCLSSDRAQMKAHADRYDLLINCVSAQHDYGDYLKLLAPFGAMALVGMPPEKMPVSAGALINNNRRLAGSSIGGMAETQAMLEFCAAKKIVSDVEVIPAKDINAAWERTIKGEVRYRFSIDAATLAT